MSSPKVYRVGDIITPWKWTPTELQLRQYAEASGDYNPIHLDDKYAQKAGLGGVISHGMLTMAQMGAMLTHWIQDNGYISEFEVGFKKMVRPGDTIHFAGRIKEVLDNTIQCELGAHNQEGIEVIFGSAYVTLYPNNH